MSDAGEPFALRVAVPARSEFLHLVRLNVAGALGDAGFSVEEIDDVKIAVEELSSTLLRSATGENLDVTINVDGDEATVTGSRTNPSEADVAVEEFAQTILEAVVDSYRVESTESVVTFALRKRSRER